MVYTGQNHASIVSGTVDDATAAIEAASSAFPTWSALTLAERISYMEDVLKSYDKRKDAITTALQCKLGAPYKFAHHVLISFSSFVFVCYSFICSLVGLITTMTVSVMFPSAAYIKLFGSQLSFTEKAMYVIFFLFGLVSAIVGTYATVAQELRSSST